MARSSDTTAVILVGGLGTRLRPAVADRPKALALIGGRPFLEYLLDRVAMAGVREVVLCTGYRGEQIYEHFGDSYRDLRLVYSYESEPRGTAGALRLAAPLIAGDAALVLNGDSLSDVDLGRFIAWTSRLEARLALALTHVADTDRFGRVETDASGWVRCFEEKGPGRGPGWINAGIYLIQRAILESLDEDRPLSLERDVLPRLLGRGLAGYRSPGRFLDIGTPESYANAEEFVRYQLAA